MGGTGRGVSDRDRERKEVGRECVATEEVVVGDDGGGGAGGGAVSLRVILAGARVALGVFLGLGAAGREMLAVVWVVGWEQVEVAVLESKALALARAMAESPTLLVRFF